MLKRLGQGCKKALREIWKTTKMEKYSVSIVVYGNLLH